MKLVAAVAKFRLAELRTDDAGQGVASAGLRDLGVRAPAKFAALMLATKNQSLLASEPHP